VKTLALRMARHSANGQAVAEFLDGHPRVRQVFYPGLVSHPHHVIAQKLMRAFGGVVTFLLDADREGTARFVDRLTIPVLGPSLGGVESLVEQVVLFGYLDIPPEECERFGMQDNLVRLSLGIEETEDIIADLQQALSHV
jgi:cystathionine gamma-synthase